MYTLFGIPNCNTVKKAMDFLKSKKIDFAFIDFKKQKPTVEQIKKWKEAFGDLPVNKTGLTYRKYKSEYESLTESQKIKFLIEQSSMIKRPILEKNSKVLTFGFSEEDYSKSLKQ